MLSHNIMKINDLDGITHRNESKFSYEFNFWDMNGNWNVFYFVNCYILLKLCNLYIYYWNLQFLNNVIIKIN